jgi:hypothetical protein
MEKTQWMSCVAQMVGDKERILQHCQVLLYCNSFVRFDEALKKEY